MKSIHRVRPHVCDVSVKDAVRDWSKVIGDPVIADAIRDRLEHLALAIHITGESHRGVRARKLASKKKE